MFLHSHPNETKNNNTTIPPEQQQGTSQQLHGENLELLSATAINAERAKQIRSPLKQIFNKTANNTNPIITTSQHKIKAATSTAIEQILYGSSAVQNHLLDPPPRSSGSIQDGGLLGRQLSLPQHTKQSENTLPPVPMSVIQKIKKGEFVNFDNLLPGNLGRPTNTSISLNLDGETLNVSNPQDLQDTHLGKRKGSRYMLLVTYLDTVCPDQHIFFPQLVGTVAALPTIHCHISFTI